MEALAQTDQQHGNDYNADAALEHAVKEKLNVEPAPAAGPAEDGDESVDLATQDNEKQDIPPKEALTKTDQQSGSEYNAGSAVEYAMREKLPVKSAPVAGSAEDKESVDHSTHDEEQDMTPEKALSESNQVRGSDNNADRAVKYALKDRLPVQPALATGSAKIDKQNAARRKEEQIMAPKELKIKFRYVGHVTRKWLPVAPALAAAPPEDEDEAVDLSPHGNETQYMILEEEVPVSKAIEERTKQHKLGPENGAGASKDNAVKQEPRVAQVKQVEDEYAKKMRIFQEKRADKEIRKYLYRHHLSQILDESSSEESSSGYNSS